MKTMYCPVLNISLPLHPAKYVASIRDAAYREQTNYNLEPFHLLHNTTYLMRVREPLLHPNKQQQNAAAAAAGGASSK